MLEADRLFALGHSRHHHAAALSLRRRLDQVELEAQGTVAEETQLDRGLTLDLVGRVAEDEGKGVVEDVERGLPGVRIRPGQSGA